MFKRISRLELEIANSNHYRIINDQNIILTKQNILYSINPETNQELAQLEFEKEIQELIPIDSNELIIFMGKKSKRLDFASWRKIDDSEFEKYRVSPIKPYNNLVFVRIPDEIDNDKEYRGLYSLEQRHIIWQSDLVHNPIILGGSLFSNNFVDGKVERFDLQTGNLLWSQSVVEPGRHTEIGLGSKRIIHEGEVDNFLGVYKNILWLVLKNGLLLGLDVESGRILHEIKEPSVFPDTFQLIKSQELNFFYSAFSMLDAENGKIFKLFQSNSSGAPVFYHEIDLESAELQLKIEQISFANPDSFYMAGGAIGFRWPFDSDYIYLCNYRDYQIALFDRRTKKIEWVHEMEVDEKNKSFIIKMKVQGNRWYILDYSKTLYVYERV